MLLSTKNMNLQFRLTQVLIACIMALILLAPTRSHCDDQEEDIETILDSIRIVDDRGNFVHSAIHKVTEIKQFMFDAEDGVLDDLNFRCKASTRLIAEPVGDTHTSSWPLTCYNLSQLIFQVYSIETVTQLAKNTKLALSAGKYGVAMHGFAEIAQIYSIGPYIEKTGKSDIFSILKSLDITPITYTTMLSGADITSHDYFSANWRQLAEDFADHLTKSSSLQMNEFFSKQVAKQTPYIKNHFVELERQFESALLHQTAKSMAIVLAEKEFGVPGGAQFDATQSMIVMNPTLQGVIKRFQENKGLETTGMLDYKTIRMSSGLNSAQLFYDTLSIK